MWIIKVSECVDFICSEFVLLWVKVDDEIVIVLLDVVGFDVCEFVLVCL